MRLVKNLRSELGSYASSEKAAFFPRFFKSGPGEYGEGDKFLGIIVPNCRSVAKKYYQELSLTDVKTLLESKWHEERLVALLILLLKFNKADGAGQEEIYLFYLANIQYINNWDLVDLSCRDIIGRYIFEHPALLPKLDELAQSESLWERRIAMISTFYFLMKNDPAPTLQIAEQLLTDRHDLIQKAVGWMLRELGKRIDQQILIDFLRIHYDQMGRTTLRYAIEKFSPETRAKYLKNNFG